MNTFRVRAGKYRLRSGAEVRVIDGAFSYSAESGRFCESLKRNADDLTECVPDMAGYVIIAWDDRGRASVGWRVGSASSVPLHMVPTYTAELLRMRMTAAYAAEQVTHVDPMVGA